MKKTNRTFQPLPSSKIEVFRKVTKMADEGEKGKVKRLYRSRKDKIIGGVCGGVADYLEADPVVIRLLWLFSVMIFGFGFLLYIVAWIIIPPNPDHPTEKAKEPGEKRSAEWNLSIGVVLLILGIILLLGQFHFFDYGWFRFHFFPWRLFWPLLLIGAGIFLLVSGTTVGKAVGEVRKRASEARLCKSRTEKMIFGVCGGLGRYFHIDPTVVRVLWVIATIMSAGVLVLLYIVMAVLMKFDDEVEEEVGAESQTGNSQGPAS